MKLGVADDASLMRPTVVREFDRDDAALSCDGGLRPPYERWGFVGAVTIICSDRRRTDCW